MDRIYLLLAEGWHPHEGALEYYLPEERSALLVDIASLSFDTEERFSLHIPGHVQMGDF